MVPAWPDNVNTPLLLPEQTVVLPIRFPPTALLVTVTVAMPEFTEVQLPTTALNWVVCVRLVKASEVVVLLIVDQVLPLLTEDSHLIIFPELPVRFNVPLLLPEHTVALPLTVPPAVTGSTTNVAVFEVLLLQLPFTTTE
jgi:hypothetical protein